MKKSRLPSSVDAPAPVTNSLQLKVNIDLDLRNLVAWSPGARRAFMIGLGEVLAALREGAGS